MFRSAKYWTKRQLIFLHYMNLHTGEDVPMADISPLFLEEAGGDLQKSREIAHNVVRLPVERGVVRHIKSHLRLGIYRLDKTIHLPHSSKARVSRPITVPSREHTHAQELEASLRSRIADLEGMVRARDAMISIQALRLAQLGA